MKHLFATLPIEQPERVSDDGSAFFFLRGYSHSGAEFGVTLTREEVVKCLTETNGPGALVKQADGHWYWQQS